MDISDEKDSDERDQKSKNDEERSTEYIKVYKLGTWVQIKIMITLRNNLMQLNCMNMSDDKESDERYQIDKNDEERVTNDI